MGPREWGRLKMKVKKKKWGGMTHGAKTWRNRKNQGKSMDGRVGLKQKKNASSSKIRAKAERIDVAVCNFVRME